MRRNLSQKERFLKMKNKLNKKRLLGIGLKVMTVVTVLVVGNNTVFATDNPLVVIDNLKEFMYQIIGAIGAILLLWGIVQIGMAIKSHDPSQRANRFYDSCWWCNNSFCKTNIRTNIRLSF